MIKVNNLSVSFNLNKVLDNISIDLPNKGLISFIGPSGCGKTTLLNAISGLFLDYQGNIEIDNINLKELSETKRDNFRINKIGFIFQDFKLFELENVENNVSFPLEVISGYFNYRNKKRIDDVIEIVGLKNKKKQLIKYCSGGEKQRAAIARALINNPKIILADEPTGSLDDLNGLEIMNLLKKISKDRLVILVSHNLESVNAFSDKIISLKDGKIIDICIKNNLNNVKEYQIIDYQYKNRRPFIPLKFIIRHSLTFLQLKKWRTLVVTSITSLALIGIGIAISISSSISSSIKEATSSIISDNQIIVNLEKESKPLLLESISMSEMEDIKSRYIEEVEDIGTVYDVNFNQQFLDEDNFYINANNANILINNYSSYQINEFKWLDKTSEEFYPYTPKKLEDDEIIMNLSLSQVYDICYQLQIVRTVESFSDYLINNDLEIIHITRNDEWSYYDEHIYRLKAFRLDYDASFYHLNHLWNEKIFEIDMRMPVTHYLSINTYLPWTMKKAYYLEVDIDKRDKFLNKVKYDNFTNIYQFEILNARYYPYSPDYINDIKNISKILVFTSNQESIPLSLIEEIRKISPNLKEVTLGNYGSYLIMPEALMMGFFNYTYFSNDFNLLEDSLDKLSSYSSNNSGDLNVNNIIVGHYSKSSQNGVIFKQIPPILTESIKFNSLDEIAISQGLASKLNLMKNDYLNVGFIILEQRLNNGKIYRDYKINKLLIKEIIDEPNIVIYQDYSWIIDYYQCRLAKSIFDLAINSLSFNIDKGVDINKEIALIKRALPSYEVINPLGEINKSVDEICFYIEIALFAFSLIAVLISIFLLSVSNYLHALEIRKDIGLSRVIGVSQKESNKFVYMHSLLMSGLSFVFSSVELLMINLVIEKAISDYFYLSFSYQLSFNAFIYMFILSMLIALISSFLISHKVNKFTPLQSLKAI